MKYCFLTLEIICIETYRGHKQDPTFTMPQIRQIQHRETFQQDRTPLANIYIDSTNLHCSSVSVRVCLDYVSSELSTRTIMT